jgi:transcriptional regulator with PAS, ATPase and Fis domain
MLMNGVDEQVDINVSKSKKISKAILNKEGKGLALLVGDSPAINLVKDLVKKFASLKEPALIIGETGTGKELVSRAIHEEGPFSKEPFLAINCGALTESLLQSELFGYVAGAFTGAQKERQGIFEAAGKGTVFLDEFGDISPQMQVSLLRVLESNEIRLIGDSKTRQIECKIVIATNIDLHQAVEAKKFREDLYFRLTRFDIKLPPLRERKEDIPLLINYFLDLNKAPDEMPQRLSKELLEALTNYRWSGNIRELKNEIERLKILHADAETLNLEDFDFKRLLGMAPIFSKKEDAPPEKKLPITKEKNEELVLDHEKILKIVQRGTKAETRHKVIKELFQTYKKLTRSQIVEITAINPGLVSKELQVLCKAGFIKKIMPTNSVKSHYFVLVE